MKTFSHRMGFFSFAFVALVAFFLILPLSCEDYSR